MPRLEGTRALDALPHPAFPKVQHSIRRRPAAIRLHTGRHALRNGPARRAPRRADVGVLRRGGPRRRQAGRLARMQRLVDLGPGAWRRQRQHRRRCGAHDTSEWGLSKAVAILTLLHVGIAAVEGALRRRGRREDVRHRFQAILVADASVCQGDARFPAFKSAFTCAHALVVEEGVRIPSDFANIEELVPFPLGTAGCAAFALRLILAHPARRAILLVVIQFGGVVATKKDEPGMLYTTPYVLRKSPMAMREDVAGGGGGANVAGRALLISRLKEERRKLCAGCSRDIHVLRNVIGWNLHQPRSLSIDRYRDSPSIVTQYEYQTALSAAAACLPDHIELIWLPPLHHCNHESSKV